MRGAKRLLVFVPMIVLGICLGGLLTAARAAVAGEEHAQLIRELREAHKLLAEADHDYDGHRAKAEAEVHKALRELGGGPHPQTQPADAGKKVPHKDEAQSKSDAQLRQARQILEGVRPQVEGKHSKLPANVSAAIDEIDAALKVK